MLRAFEAVVVEVYVLRAVQFWFDYPIYALKRLWNFLPHHIAIDHFECMEGVLLERSIPYGRGWKEKYHMLTPKPMFSRKSRGSSPLLGNPEATTRHLAATTRAIVYCHGGGFVATCREMYYNSLCYLVRSGGFHIAVLDYPMAPQAQHPVPLLSVLRALSHLQSVRSDRSSGVTYEKIHLIGDSAGANLILHAAALISSPSLWMRLKTQVKADPRMSSAYYRDIDQWTFPEIQTCTSIYGMLSRKSAEKVPFPVGHGLRFLWRCVTGGMTADYEQKSKRYPAAFDDLLVETIAREAKIDMPPTFFAVGDIDPLVGSSVVTHERMKMIVNAAAQTLRSKGIHHPLLRLYPGGFHGFFGVPPEWQLGLWRKAAQPAAKDVYSFLECFHLSDHADGNVVKPTLSRGQRQIGTDFFGVIVASQIVIFMPMFIIGMPLVLLIGLRYLWSVVEHG